MLRVGLTGGVACGKSTIAAMFEKRGAHVVRADEIAHKLMEPGAAVYEQVVAAFGKEILNEDGTISRPKLADAAFPNRIRELNAIVHPAVIEDQNSWMDQIEARDPHAIAIVEAALMIEAGAHVRFDKLIVVTCELEQKIARFAKRTGLDAESARREVLRRMDAQMPEEDKVGMADFVVDNSGSLEKAETQVNDIWQILKSTEGKRVAQ